MRRLLWRNLKGDAAPHLPKSLGLKFRKIVADASPFWRNLKGDAAPHFKKFRFKFRKDCCGASPFMAEP